MRPSILLLLFLGFVCLGATAARALTPAHYWSQRYGSTSSDGGYAVAVDNSGNVILAGTFNLTVSFGGTSLTSAGGTNDIFLAKYTSGGGHIWSKGFGSSTTADVPGAVAVDASGNVFFTGYFGGSADFGSGVPLVSAGGLDVVLAKYNSSGVHQWNQRFGGTGDDIGAGIAVDASGNVFLTATYVGSVSFGGSSLASNGGRDIVLAKYDAGGVHQWSQAFGSTVDDFSHAVAVDGSGSVFMTGSFFIAASFGGSTLTSAGSSDIFLAKYNSSGVHQWSQRFGSTSGDTGTSVAVDGSGDVFLAGVFQETVDFGGGGLVSAGVTDIVVAKFDGSGVHQWSHGFGNTTPDAGNSVAVNPSGDVFVTGNVTGPVDFGGGALAWAGGSDIFVAKFDAGGVHQWSQSFGQATTDVGRSIAASGSETVAATGEFNGTVNLGGLSLTSAGINDVYSMKYGADPLEPVIESITDIGNDQGRQVKIRFARGGYDVSGAPALMVRYEAFRRDDPPPAAAPAWRDPAGLSPRELLDEGWTQVGSVSSHGATGYGMDVPTIGDSTLALGPYNSTFVVRAASSSPFLYYDSPADSGYSLDNLAPGVPLNLVYASGELTWDESAAADFDFFTVYGSNTDSFGAATLVDYSVATTINVTASPYVFYFVTATDFSGNEGQPAKVNTLSGVGGTPKSYVLSVSNYPNPFNPRTTVSYTVPSRDAVTVVIYDARGARVATLVDHRDHAAGAYTIDWDGRADSGATASSGVYFARIEHNGAARSRKMVLLK